VRIAVACFVKTLGVSPVKTRLAEGIGRSAADEVYKTCVELIRQSLSKAASENSQDVYLIPHWAVAEQSEISATVWSDFPVVYQGEQGLGHRLKRVYENLSQKFDGVVLIGADCPLLSPDKIKAAAQKVAMSDNHILGPTDDGGYYLFGSRFPVDAQNDNPSVWLNVPYSAPDTSEKFIGALSLKRPVSRLETLFDLDTKSDLERLLRLATKDVSPWEKDVLIAMRARLKL